MSQMLIGYSGFFVVVVVVVVVVFCLFVFLVCTAARDGKRRTDRETFPENYTERVNY